MANSIVRIDGESAVTRSRPRTMAIAAMLLAALALAGGCAPVVGVRALTTARPGATTYHEVQVDGRGRRFLLHLPP